MGALLQGGNRRGGRRRGFTPVSEINVTPFVDVCLVLLIVFMVAAPLMTVGVPVDLPQSDAKQISENIEPLVISIDSKGKVYIQDTEINMDTFVPKLSAITKNKLDTVIYIRGDHRLDYGKVMQVMGLINAAGYSKVALIAEAPKGKEPR